MIEYSKDMEMKHSLKQVGKKYVFTIRDLLPDDGGHYQLDIEYVTMFSTDFKSKTNLNNLYVMFIIDDYPTNAFS